jgi:site-specific DNA recombinase
MRLVRNGRSRAAVAAVQAPTRCAVYTRKSTDEGLDKDFNSLDAQRESAEAFIASQRAEGWAVLPDRYDDGGWSGATAERPALKRLLADVTDGKIDTVIVYKLDRLSRSMRDFLNLIALFEKHDVAFVSVTQQFNTSTPVGRMTLRMLMSFAEFERDLVSERTRDKLQAARRKGKSVGGHLILGYDRDHGGGRLVVNRDEADVVREIFRLFLELRSLVAVAAELTRRGVTLKRWTTRDGKIFGGGRFDKVSLRRLLTNYTYIGKVNFEGTIYDGEHEGIASPKVFREVQRILDVNRRDRGTVLRNSHGALLRGLLRCGSCGTAMVHAPTKAGGRLYRYYRCANSNRRGAAACPTRSVSADRVEAFVVDQIKRIGADPALQQSVFEQALAQVKAQCRGLRAEAKRLERDLVTARADVERLVAGVTRVTGPAADAVAVELARSQERVTTLESRQREVEAEIAALAKQDIDREAVAVALLEFDPLWDVLLTPERERVLKLLVDRIDYGGGELAIQWRLAGFGQLAAEVGS